MSLKPNTTSKHETDSHKVIALSPDLPNSSNETNDHFDDQNLHIDFLNKSDALNGQQQINQEQLYGEESNLPRSACSLSQDPTSSEQKCLQNSKLQKKRLFIPPQKAQKINKEFNSNTQALGETDTLLQKEADELVLNLDILMVEPLFEAIYQSKKEDLRVKAFLRRHAAYIRKLLFIASVNEELQKQTPPKRLVQVGKTAAADCYDQEFKLIGTQLNYSDTELKSTSFQQFNFKVYQPRLKQLARLERNPHLISYFSQNISILNKLHALKKPLLKEWRSIVQKNPGDILNEGISRHQLQLEKSKKQPHFVFHLSKRLFSESALKSHYSFVTRKHLNIISSEYIDDSKQFITQKKNLNRSEAFDTSPNCIRKRDKDSMICISCGQIFEAIYQRADYALLIGSELPDWQEWSTCKACAFNLVSQFLSADDEGFNREIGLTTFRIDSMSN